MLIDESYFIGPLEIAQLGQKSVGDKLTVFINRWEPVIMEAALGYDFYQAFKIGLTVPSPEQRWKDLRDGTSFNNVVQIRKRFVGFGNSDTLISPLAGFIYYEFMRDLATQNTGIGVVKNKGENSESAGPAQKMVDAYNEACRQINLLWEFLYADRNAAVKVYPEFDYRQVYGYGLGFEYGYRILNGWMADELYSFRPINTFGI